MALKTKADLETLDIVYLGQPFVQVATEAITATNLDTVYQAQPFYAVDPAGGVVEEGAASVTSTATMAVTAQVNRDLDAVLSAEATATVAGKRIRNAEAAMASATDLSATVNYITDNDVYAQAEFQFTADGTVVRDYDVFTSAEATIEISGQVLRDIDVVMQSDTNVTVAGVVQRDFDVALQAEFQFTVNGTVIKNFSATLEEAATFSVQGQRNADIDLVAFSESAVSTAFTRIRNGEIAAVESFTQFTADGTRIIDVDAVLTSESQFFADINRTRLGEATPSSTATLDIPVFSRLRPIRRAPKTLTAVNNAKLSTVHEKFGPSSLYLDGTGDRVNVSSSEDFAFGTGDFAIEMWIRPADVSTVMLLENRSTGLTDTNGWNFRIGGTGDIQFYRGNTFIVGSGSNTKPGLNAWSHIAITRSSGTFRAYVNGELVGSATPSSVNFTNTNLIIGEIITGTSIGDYNGYIDELRISKGAARYTNTFAVAAQEFRNDANTVLLAHFNGANNSTTFVDAAGDYLDAVSSVTASVSRIKVFDANLTSTATMAVTGNYTVSADVFTEANATLTSTPGFVKNFDIDVEASAGTLTAVAKVGAFLVDLNANSTLTADISVTRPIEVNMSSQATMSANGGKLIDFTVGVQGGGVAINGTHLKLTSSASGLDERAESFLISFWANNADGTILQTSGADSDEETFRIQFDAANNRFEVYQRTDWTLGANDNRTIRWTVDSTGWHHYVLYQDYRQYFGAGMPTTTRMTLIVDGAIKPVSAIINNDSSTTLNTFIDDSIFLRNGSPSTLKWFIGAIPDAIGYDSDPTDIAENFTGEIQQFAVWFADGSGSWNTAVPNAFTNIENLYSPTGPLDLGSDGTATGLRAPEVYLRLDDYTDYSDLGDLSTNVSWLNLATTYTPTTADNADPYNYPIAGIIDFEANGIVSQFVTANLNSASSLTVSAKKAVTLAANVSSQVTTDIAALRTKQLAADLLAEGFAVTAAAKIADFFVPMNAVASLQAEGSTNTFVSANLNGATNLLADANVAFVGAANLNNETALTVSADVLITAGADLNAQATLSAALRRLIKANADLNSATDLAAQTLGSVIGSANLNVVTAQTATAKKTARVTADLNTRATFAARVDRIVRFSADIQSNGFILVAGEVLQLDPELTYVIEQETRTFVITGEDREYIIDEESRVYIISEETREYAVEPSTAVNII